MIKNFWIMSLVFLFGQTKIFAAEFPSLDKNFLIEAMTQGGDDRIVLDRDKKVNKYLTGPIARPHVIARSSSTSNNASTAGFLAAQHLYDCLLAAQDLGGATRYFEYAMYSIRERIKKYWASDVKSPCAVVTSPSGSDAEMIPAIAALCRHKDWKCGEVFQKPLMTSIVIASGEVGTGTALAAGVRHFSGITPRGISVKNASPIDGLVAGAIDVIEIKIRDAYGNMVSAESIEQKIAQILERVIEKEGQIGLLHVVHVCKTGYGAPRFTFAKAMKEKYKDSLVVVVDAAHARMDSAVASDWLNSGYWVFLTGSKFAGGAPFSGAVLIPHKEAMLFRAAESQQIPRGLGDYFTPSDCDESLLNLKAALPCWYNIGLALRWETALKGMADFVTVAPAQRDRGISRWVSGIRSLVSASKHLVPLEDIVECRDFGIHETCLGKKSTVMVFGVKVQNEVGIIRYLTMSELRVVYELMTQDLSKKFSDLSDDAAFIASVKCAIGQPVQIATAGPCLGVLRVAIAAPEIFKAIGHERLDPAVLIDDLLSDDEIVVKKLDFIAEHWSEFAS